MPPPGPSQIDPSTASLVPQGKHVGQSGVPLVRPATVIGARHRSHLHLLSRSVSKAHALIVKGESGYYVRDLASRTHVYVNGRQVHESDLADGDLLKIGNFVFQFRNPVGPAARTRAMAAGAGHFEVAGADAPIGIPGRALLIGRRAECDLSLVESSVSTAHAILFDLDGRWFLRDLSSRTGTFVNGRQIHQEEIHFGDEVRIGETVLAFEAAADGVSRPVVDELEDLIGTAPLLEPEEAFDSPDPLPERPVPSLPARAVSEPVVPVTPAPSTAVRNPDAPIPLNFDDDLPGEPVVSEASGGLPASAANDVQTPLDAEGGSPSDDLNLDVPDPVVDDLSFADDAPAPKVPVTVPSQVIVPGSGVPAPMGVMQAERRPGGPPAPPADADLVALDGPEIDLSTDPDVSGGDDTAALKLAPDDTQKKPALSDRVVDAPDPSPDPADTVTDGQRLLVDAELHKERLTSSATAADLQDAAEEAIAAANLESGDADAFGPDNLSAIEPTPGTARAPQPDAADAPDSVELEPRKGWRRRGKKEPKATARATPAPIVAKAQGGPIDAPTPSALPISTPTPVTDVAPIDVPEAPEADIETESRDELPIPVLSEDEPEAGSTAPGDAALDFGLSPSLVDANADTIPSRPAAVDEPEPEPVPVDELAAIDFSSLSLPNELGVGAADDGASLDFADEAEARPGLDLGLTPPVPLAEAEAVFEAAPEPAPARPAVPEPIPARPSEPEPPVVDDGLPAAPVPQPEPADKPRRVRKPSVKPLKAEKPPTPKPVKVPKATKGRAVRKPPAAAEPEPVAAVDVSPAARASDEPRVVAATAGRVEVLDTTEPTPESALDLGDLSPAAVGTADDALVAPAETLTDTTFGRQLAEFAADAPEPIVDDARPAHADAATDDQSPVAPSEYVADVSHSADFHPADLAVDTDPPADPEPARPLNAFEQIAASMSTMVDPPDDATDVDAPNDPPAGGLPDALATPIDVVDVRPVDPDPIDPVDFAPLADAAPGAQAEAVNDGHWPMPSEDDLLLPDDEPGPASQDLGRDQASFIGGLPMALDATPDVLEAPEPDRASATPIDEIGPTLMGFDDEPDAEPAAARDYTSTDSTGDAVNAVDASAEEGDAIDASPGAVDLSAVDPDDLAAPAAPGEQLDPDSLLDDDAPAATPSPAPSIANVAPPTERPAPASATARVVAQGPPVMPPRPRQMGRRNAPAVFGKTPFDIVPEDASVQPVGDTIPPFTGPGPATFGRVTTAFDGLAMPPVREADVFSHQVAGHAFGDGENGNAAPAGRRARPAAPGAASVPPPPAGFDDGPIDYATPRAAVAPDGAPGRAPVRGQSPGFRPPAGSPAEARPAPRRRRFGIRWLLPAMLVCMLGAAGAVFGLVNVASSVEGFIAFENLQKLPAAERARMHDELRSLARDPAVRDQAKAILDNGRSDMAPGFLANTVDGTIEFDRTVTVDFPHPGGRLVVRRASPDPADDAFRVEALLQALVVANAPRKDDAADLRELARKAKDELAAREKEVVSLTARIAEAKRTGEQRPRGEDVRALEAEGARLEQALADATAKVRSAKDELARLQAAPAPGAVAARAGVGVADDVQLKQWAAELADAQAKRDAARAAKGEAVRSARATLDAAMAEFATEIGSAQAMAAASPELTAYLDAARKLQDWATKLNDNLGDRQRRQDDTMAELLRSFKDKRDARLAEARQSDGLLRALGEQAGLARRQMNVAREAGRAADADKLAAQLADLERQQAERLKAVAGADDYAEEVARLESLMAAARAQTAEDRKQTESLLAEMQAALAAAAPAVDKLPAGQKATAEQLADRSRKLNDAQRAYATAVDDAGAEPVTAGTPEAAALDERAADLAAKIDARQRELADAAAKQLDARQADERRRLVGEKQRELAEAERNADDARAAARANVSAVLLAQGAIDAARTGSDTVPRLQRELDAAKAGIVKLRSKADAAQAKADSAVIALPVSRLENVDVVLGDDRRMTYVAISTAAIALVFVGLILLSLTGKPETALAAVAQRSDPPDDDDADDDANDEAPPTTNGTPGHATPEGREAMRV